MIVDIKLSGEGGLKPMNMMICAMLTGVLLIGWPNATAADAAPATFRVGTVSSASQEAVFRSNIMEETLVVDVMNDPLLDGFGRFIFPTEGGLPNSAMKLSGIGSLLPYHSHISTSSTVSVINYMLQQAYAGLDIFYDIYSDAEKRSEPSKQNTGLFFFRGRPGAPLAIICADGGFSYVGSIHESFPLALELSKKGYNAFAIQYRAGGADVACEDLAAALTFIFENAKTLQVDTDGYSLWGASAGARMAAQLGSYGAAAFGGGDLPRAVTVVMQYIGHSDYTAQDSPTYVCIGEKDGIANPQTMVRRVNDLKSLGIDTECHLYPNIGHGFGLGLGTSAEGWWKDALAFWEKHLP
jgi:acetyl esterase/lipase